MLNFWFVFFLMPMLVSGYLTEFKVLCYSFHQLCRVNCFEEFSSGESFNSYRLIFTVVLQWWRQIYFPIIFSFVERVLSSTAPSSVQFLLWIMLLWVVVGGKWKRFSKSCFPFISARSFLSLSYVLLSLHFLIFKGYQLLSI